MITMPLLYKDSFFDNFFDAPFKGQYKPVPQNGIMKTDVKETEGSFELDIELPGYSKEDIQAELKEGYLTVSASKTENKDEESQEGKFIRRERFFGSCSRSFYVGDVVTEEDITAKFEDGILKMSIPKKEKEPEIPEKKFIAIA